MGFAVGGSVGAVPGVKLANATAKAQAEGGCSCLAVQWTKGGPELLYIKFTRKEQTSRPARVLKGESRNC